MVFSDNNLPQPPILPLTEVQVRMVYPDGIITVDNAVSYLLEPHAYRPAYRDTSGERIAKRGFMNNFGTDPVPMSRAMERLLGDDAQVMLDRDRKLYAFRMKNPGEPGMVFSDLDPGAAAGGAIPASREQVGQPDPDPIMDAVPDAGTAPHNADPAHAETENESPVEDRNNCRSIQFRNRQMLSEAVRKYFLDCGFNEVLWKLGEPGRYADYRLSQDIDVPLPERHLDLIELLQTRFGIGVLINEDNSIEFHDENSTR